MIRKGVSLFLALAALVAAAAIGFGAGSSTPETATASGASASAKHGRVVRTGRINDTDTSQDGVFNLAYGHAGCERGERLVTGGVQLKERDALFGGPSRVQVIESSPVPKKSRQWFVTLSSDLGGKARALFRVVVVCER
jgi:hypothetical protein